MRLRPDVSRSQVAHLYYSGAFLSIESGHFQLIRDGISCLWVISHKEQDY